MPRGGKGVLPQGRADSRRGSLRQEVRNEVSLIYLLVANYGIQHNNKPASSIYFLTII